MLRRLFMPTAKKTSSARSLAPPSKIEPAALGFGFVYTRKALRRYSNASGLFCISRMWAHPAQGVAPGLFGQDDGAVQRRVKDGLLAHEGPAVQGKARGQALGRIAGDLLKNAVEVAQGVEAALRHQIRHGDVLLLREQLDGAVYPQQVHVLGKGEAGHALEVTGKIGLRHVHERGGLLKAVFIVVLLQQNEKLVVVGEGRLGRVRAALQLLAAEDVRQQGEDDGVHFFGVKGPLLSILCVQLVHALTGVVAVRKDRVFQAVIGAEQPAELRDRDAAVRRAADAVYGLPLEKDAAV